MPEKFKVVISGISGRFPECDDIDTFKEKLYSGDDFITVDDRKWPVGFKHKRLDEKMITDATGKFLNFHEYDHTVFRMSQTFASSNDIVNRKILEPSFEAIIDAGINPYSLDGSNVSVFISTGINENDNVLTCSYVPSNILCLIGCNKTMLSNRVSYALNLKGPSITNYVDVHGGLESLITGYRYVSEGTVDAAVVGAVSCIVDPRFSLHHLFLGMLCPDGITRSFDEWANGYARSESIVCLYLQRAEDAKRSYGEIIFCDSRYLGSDLPNFVNYGESYLKTCMQQLLESDLNTRSNLSNIAYVEMNSFGHKEMDKIESNVVAQLIAKDKNEPLLVGSIKSNIGHTQGAAGLMSVLKALFALDSATLAPNRHLQKPNVGIEAFKTHQLQVVTETCSMPGNTVAVNSFGLCGNIGLAIIQQHKKDPLLHVKSNTDPFPRLLLICGRQEKGLMMKLKQIESSPYNPEFIALANDAFRQYMPLHIYRGFAILPPPFRPIHYIKEKGDQNRPVWLIFSGMGSQWNGMGKSLLKLPLFSETVAKCDKVLRQKNIDIYHILTSDDTTIFDDIVNAFVGIITVQIGLYEIFKALNLKVDGILGHSVGENACAYADGCLSLEQAVLASWARGVASNEAKTITGMMAAVGKGYAEMKDVLPEGIQVACHNSEDSCTLTGLAESVKSYVQELKGKGVFAKAVNVANIAYHSKYIAPIGPGLLHKLQKVIVEPKLRSPKWISTSVPESRWDTPLAQHCSAEYLTNNLLSPVLFEEGCKHIPANAICIEFAPHGLLQAILKRSMPDSCTNIPLTSRVKVEDNLNFLLSSIGMLYVAGLDPHVNNIFPSVEYPVARGTPHLSPYCTWYHQNSPIPFHLSSFHKDDCAMVEELIPIRIRDDSDSAFLVDHRVNDIVTIPKSFFIFLVWKMFLSDPTKDKIGSSTVVLEGVRTHRDVIISKQDTKYATVMIQYGSGNFQVMLHNCEDREKSQVILTGRIHQTSENVATQLPISTEPTERFLTKTQFYSILEQKNQISVHNSENGNDGKMKDQIASPLVLCKNIDVDDVSRLIKMKADDPDRRYLYIMDEIVSKQKLNELVQKQMELDIPVSVLKQGELGSYRNFIQENNKQRGNGITVTYSRLKSKIRSGPRCLKYVCFDDIEGNPLEQPTSNVCGSTPTLVGCSNSIFCSYDLPQATRMWATFGFSYVTGVNTTEQQIMGLAATTLTGNPQYDPHLCWTVPRSRSSEEAAIMIYLYAQAYRLLVLLPAYRLKYANTVMINVGTDYLLAEAFIVLSLNRNLEIFITVDSNEDAELIKERFPKIQYDHIFRSKNCSYIQIGQKMKGKGIDLLVNCRSGVEHVNTSLECLAINGIYIEVGTNNCQESNDLGLQPFLKMISFHTIQRGVSDLLQLPVETKKVMKNFIENCIETGIITPLKFHTQSVRSTKLMKCHTIEEFQNSSAPTIKYDPKHSYLILGKSIEDFALLELIEWLLDQGASKIIIALEKLATLSRNEHRINRLLARASVHILFTSASKLNDRHEVRSLLEQIEDIGPLEATFFVAIKTAEKKISNLNDLVSPNVTFVGLSSAGLKEFEQRRAAGSPAILFHTDEGPKGVMSVLPRLNELLARDDNNNTDAFLYQVVNPDRGICHSKQFVQSSLRDYLPLDLKTLSAIGQEETMEPTFIEMSSSSVRYTYCKGVNPIFALPAVHSLILQPLFQRLQYPVFSATTTSMNSVKELADKLYSSLEKIQPTGSINMISETWTLPLALKLISYAQRDNRTHQIFVLEGTPQVWSYHVKRLQSLGRKEFDRVCTDEIFHFIKRTKKDHCSESLSFENNVEMLAKNATYDLKTAENVVRAAKKIKHIINAMSRIQFTNEMLEYAIWFERCPSDEALKLSVTSEVLIFNEPNFRSLLQNPEVSRAINKNTKYNW